METKDYIMIEGKKCEFWNDYDKSVYWELVDLLENRGELDDDIEHLWNITQRLGGPKVTALTVGLELASEYFEPREHVIADICRTAREGKLKKVRSMTRLIKNFDAQFFKRNGLGYYRNVDEDYYLDALGTALGCIEHEMYWHTKEEAEQIYKHQQEAWEEFLKTKKDNKS